MLLAEIDVPLSGEGNVHENEKQSTLKRQPSNDVNIFHIIVKTSQLEDKICKPVFLVTCAIV